MGKFLLKDVYIELDGVNLSNYGFNIDTPSEKTETDVSGFNPNNTSESLVGNRVDRITAQFTQDFASGGPHDVLRSLYYADTTFSIKIRPTSASCSATNPELRGNVKLRTYNGLSGALNARAEVTAELVPADSTGVVWYDT